MFIVCSFELPQYTCNKISVPLSMRGASLQGSDVIIGNVGDSRAILGTMSDDGSLKAVQLTVDLKPNLPRKFPDAQIFKLCIVLGSMAGLMPLTYYDKHDGGDSKILLVYIS